MKEEKKRCWNCFYYASFYTKGDGCFRQEKIGTCNKHNKTVAKQDTCEKWLLRPRQRAETISMTSLAEISEHLAELKQILKEEQEYENKIIGCYVGE